MTDKNRSYWIDGDTKTGEDGTVYVRTSITTEQFQELLHGYVGERPRWVSFDFIPGQEQDAKSFANGLTAKGWRAWIDESQYPGFTRVICGLGKWVKKQADQP